jgi:hypothetical protein
MTLTAADMKERLALLEAERASALEAGLGANQLYMADLEEEIEATRQLYVLTAVSEIAELRAELFGPQYG